MDQFYTYTDRSMPSSTSITGNVSDMPILYAAGISRLYGSVNKFNGTTTYALVYSDDMGTTWNILKLQKDIAPTCLNYSPLIHKVSEDGQNIIIYTKTYSVDTSLHMFLSTDGGVTFTDTSLTIPEVPTSYCVISDNFMTYAYASNNQFQVSKGTLVPSFRSVSSVGGITAFTCLQTQVASGGAIALRYSDGTNNIVRYSLDNFVTSIVVSSGAGMNNVTYGTVTSGGVAYLIHTRVNGVDEYIVATPMLAGSPGTDIVLPDGMSTIIKTAGSKIFNSGFAYCPALIYSSPSTRYWVTSIDNILDGRSIVSSQCTPSTTSSSPKIFAKADGSQIVIFNNILYRDSTPSRIFNRITDYSSTGLAITKTTYTPISILAKNDVIVGFNVTSRIGYCIVRSTKKVYKTIDGGVTWTYVSTISATIYSTTDNSYLSVSKDGLRIYFFAMSTISTPAMYISINGGVSFTAKTNGINPAATPVMWTSNDGSVSVKSGVDSVTGAMYTSYDLFDTSFLTTTRSWTAAQLPYMFYLNYDGSKIIGIGTNGTVSVSTDKGKNYVKKTTPAVDPITTAGVSESGRYIAMISQKNSVTVPKLYISSDDGSSWTTYILSTYPYTTTGQLYISNDGLILNVVGSVINVRLDLRTATEFEPLQTCCTSNGINYTTFVSSDGCMIINTNPMSNAGVTYTIRYPYRKYVLSKPDGFYTFVAGVLTKAADEASAFDIGTTFAELAITKMSGVNSVVCYTNDLSYAKTAVNYSVVPKPQLITTSTDINLTADINCVSGIRNIRFNANGNVRLAMSFDSGTTWYAIKGGGLVLIADVSGDNMLTYGSTPSDINSLANDSMVFADIYNKGKIRFMYYMYKNAIGDTCDMSSVTIATAMRPNWVLCDSTDVSQAIMYKTMTITFLKSGDYRITYIK